MPRDTLAPRRSTRRPRATSDERIFLRADKAVSYGDLMEVMNLLRGAGYLKIALVGLEKVPGDDRVHGRDLVRYAPLGDLRRHRRLTHAGIAAAMVNWRDPDEAAEPSSAIVIEFAPVPPPRSPDGDLRPGPSR